MIIGYEIVCFSHASQFPMFPNLKKSDIVQLESAVVPVKNIDVVDGNTLDTLRPCVPIQTSGSNFQYTR